MELKPRDRIVQLKILYYGPAVGGKTTNLQALHASAQGRHRGEFIAVNSQQDRTILFDLLPLRGVGFHGFDLRFQIVAVPGQAPYAATRKLVTKGADAVVFVANSAVDRLQENVASVQEMNGNLVANGLDPATIPIVFQYNKRDLPDILSVRELSAALNTRGAPWLEAVAVRGEGVLETLAAILEHTMEYLTVRYRSLALEPGETVQAWTWGAVQQVFGRTSLAGTNVRPLGGSEEDQRRVQIAVPRLPKGASEAATDKGIVESYVQVSLELSKALDQTRDERDEARRRAEEMNLTLRAIEALGEGEGSGETLRATLGQLAEGASCGRATLLGQRADRRSYVVVAAVGTDNEPFLSTTEAVEIVRRRFVPLKNALLVSPETMPEATRLFSTLEPPARALVVAPVRSGFGLHALAMFYFGATDPLPSPTALGHIGLMARALAAWFVVHRGRSVEASAEAARQTLPEIERVVRQAGQLVRAASREPQKARAHLAEAAQTLEGVARLAGGLQAAGWPGRKR